MPRPLWRRRPQPSPRLLLRRPLKSCPRPPLEQEYESELELGRAQRDALVRLEEHLAEQEATAAQLQQQINAKKVSSPSFQGGCPPIETQRAALNRPLPTAGEPPAPPQAHTDRLQKMVDAQRCEVATIEKQSKEARCARRPARCRRPAGPLLLTPPAPARPPCRPPQRSVHPHDGEHAGGARVSGRRRTRTQACLPWALRGARKLRGAEAAPLARERRMLRKQHPRCFLTTNCER